jgi:hypothetical protein
VALRGNDIAEKVWNFLTDAGINEFGTAGLMGNIQAESGMNPKNLENLCEKRLKEAGKPYCTDETYTAAVDNGEISREEFLHPLPGKQYGYGLTQLTSAGRKAGLYDLAKSKGKSIGDLETQLEFLMIELKTSYKTAYNAIKDAASIKAASDIVLKKFEIPADQSESVQNKRAANGQEFYNRFSKTGSKGGNNMSIRIGHASISENGTTSGKAGDQTGKEVCIREWYSKPWDYMAIHPDANVREKHAAAVEAACKNDNIGYSQYGTDNRNTLNTLAKAVNYDLSKVGKCNCDCSSLQNVAAVASGSGATYGSNGWTTSTMKAALQALGYKIITSSTYLKDSAYCVRGAIYVKASSHTVCGLDNGSKASQTLSAAGISGGSSGNAGTSSSGGTSSSTAGKKVESAKSFDKSLAGTYKTKGSLYLRAGAGKNKPDLVIMPDNTTVRNYGYYTLVDGVKWLYVQAVVKGVTYTGFCSSNTNYLKKL